MCAGGATTTVYPSTMAEDVAYILADSECRVVFAEDEGQVAKLREHRSELPHLDEGGALRRLEQALDGDWVIGLDDLSMLGEKHLAEHPDAVTEAIEAIEPDNLATLIYTSGTTGKPKGVRLRALLVDLRGRRHPGPADPRRERRAVPLAADGALLRQGAALHPARVRLRHRGRRSRRQDHRQPRRREADLHGCRATHLREGARAHRHHAGGRGRRQGEDLQRRPSTWA